MILTNRCFVALGFFSKSLSTQFEQIGCRQCFRPHKMFQRQLKMSSDEECDHFYDGTMDQIKEKIHKRLGLQKGYSPTPQSREHLLQYTPRDNELPPRTMRDSYSNAIIPLSTDLDLQDRYATVFGTVRYGRLLEDMDLIAVWACHKHVLLPNLPPEANLPYTFVTILVDNVIFSEIKPVSTENIRISSHVSQVGRSSLEVIVWLDQMTEGIYQNITKAYFLMAARDAVNKKAAPVNPLEPQNEEEKQIVKRAIQRRLKRKRMQETSVFLVQPNECEQAMMYDLFKRTTPAHSLVLNKRMLPENARWMSESYVANAMLPFPEHRNSQNTVFGGFLMRTALEISHLCATFYAKERPRLVCMSDISFDSPVYVDSFIKMFAYIIYTEQKSMVVISIADISDMAGNERTTNVFYFTYQASHLVPEVLPRSYHEALWYILGKRKFESASEMQ